ncbi:uncharacterized protein [Tiliqua scincoides]|uniref:uncharacterized protein n=1 Tax=Tiliqua scincoides TaxID=71010 RepID=UPI003462FF7B
MCSLALEKAPAAWKRSNGGQWADGGASAHVQTLQKEPGNVSFPGSLWLSVAAPTPAELEQNVRKHLTSSSEPILDLRTEAAAVLPVDGTPMNTTEIIPLTAMECAPVATVERAPIVTAESAPTAKQELSQSPEVSKDLAHLNTSSSSFTRGGDSDPDMALPPPPDKGPPSEAGSSGSLPWPEAPEECGPQRPNTLDLFKPLKKLEEVKQAGQRRNSDQASIKENGLESGPAAPPISEERQALQSELGKCIQDFRKIKIPISFPNRKCQWQNELLRKYQL